MNIKHQSGAVLIISMIMLLALTIIGITSSSVTGLEEKMAANTKDMNLAFQAAEAALREGEASLKTKPNFDRNQTNANQGTGGYYTVLCGTDDTGCTVETTNATGGVQVPATTAPTTTGVTPFYQYVDWYATSNKKYIPYINTGTSGKKLIGLARDPEYIIEELSCVGSGSSAQDSLEGNTTSVDTPGRVMTMRITARGWGSNINSVTTLQTVVKVTY